MTQIEQIKAEIERLINDKTDGKYVAEADITAPKRSAYLDILNFITSLLAEQPSERLGDEIDNFRCSDEFALAKRAGEEVAATARHFAQWQKEKTINKACQWLQHNAEKYVYSYGLPNYQTGLLLHDFKHAMEDNQ